MSSLLRFSGAALALSLSIASLGCGSKANDCGKVVAVRNAAAESTKAIDTSQPGGTDKALGVVEKSGAELGALSFKDEGVKTRTAAIVAADAAWLAAVRALVVVQAEFGIALANQSEAKEPAAVAYLTSQVQAVQPRLKAAQGAVNKASDERKAANEAFDAYCGVASKP